MKNHTTQTIPGRGSDKCNCCKVEKHLGWIKKSKKSVWLKSKWKKKKRKLDMGITKGHIFWDAIGHVKEFECYSEWDKEALEVSEPKNNIIQHIFAAHGGSRGQERNQGEELEVLWHNLNQKYGGL